MTKFKVGDVVERTVTDVYCGLPSGEQGVVSKAVGNLVWIKGYGDWCHLTESLRLAEQDDPLPPAPESVRYYNSFIMGNNDQNLTVEPAPEYPEEGLLHLLITPNSHSTRNVAPLSINMDPDAALQLAHDLNRMANEIKRKERASMGVQ